MIRGCLSLPFRLLSAAITVALLYLAWVNRDELRRWVHELTADPVSAAAEAEPAEVVAGRAAARLDSLARGRADSVILAAAEVEALVRDAVARRTGRAVDSVSVRLGEGEVSLRSRVDPTALPPDALGPLQRWFDGPQTVEVRGPISIFRPGMGEWRIEQVVVSRVPLPRALWERLAQAVVPGTSGSFTFPVDRWIGGIRVTPDGAILYRGRP